MLRKKELYLPWKIIFPSLKRFQMRKHVILLALAIVGGVGCTQDSLNTDFYTSTMAEPARRISGIPEYQAVMLSPEDSYPAPGVVSLRSSTCTNKYVLQIKRISNYTVQFPLRVFTKDADDEGFSAVYNTIQYHTIPTDTFATFLLFDGTDEICFDSTDNIAFLQPFYFGEDIEFEVRLFNASSNTATNAQTIEWLQGERYYFTMYPDWSGNCDNLMPAYCCEYFLSANEVATTNGGTMWFRSIWDNDWIDLVVPPEDTDFYTSERCGPIGVSWETADHLNKQGSGSANFECDNTLISWIISNGGLNHGVIFAPDGRYCFLTY
jgi:hypothetical protein